MDVLIATTNPAKLEELTVTIKAMCPHITLHSLSEFPNLPEPEETGATFEENAALKAKHYAQLTNMPAIGDDGGIMIDALQGAPGVKSKRWLGRPATDQDLISHTLEKLKGVPRNKRSAQFAGAICLYDPNTKHTLCATAATQGYIAHKPSSNAIPGFPYRALLKVLPYDKYYDELSDDEMMESNHRLLALKKLLQNFH